MGKSLASTSDVPIGYPLRYGKSNRYSGGGSGRLSRAERLEIICLVVAAGMSECSAWIIPLLERDSPFDDPMMEKMQC